MFTFLVVPLSIAAAVIVLLIASYLFFTGKVSNATQRGLLIAAGYTAILWLIGFFSPDIFYFGLAFELVVLGFWGLVVFILRNIKSPAAMNVAMVAGSLVIFFTVVSLVMKAPTMKNSPSLASADLAMAIQPTPMVLSMPTPDRPTVAYSGEGWATCTNKVEFIADVTVPDGAVIAGGETFLKTWKVRNAGTCAWPAGIGGYKLVWVGGDQMGAKEFDVLVSCPPMQETTLPIYLTAPLQPGKYKGEWMLKSGYNQQIFGLGPTGDKPFWVEIEVK